MACACMVAQFKAFLTLEERHEERRRSDNGELLQQYRDVILCYTSDLT